MQKCFAICKLERPAQCQIQVTMVLGFPMQSREYLCTGHIRDMYSPFVEESAQEAIECKYREIVSCEYEADDGK